MQARSVSIPTVAYAPSHPEPLREPIRKAFAGSLVTHALVIGMLTVSGIWKFTLPNPPNLGFAPKNAVYTPNRPDSGGEAQRKERPSAATILRGADNVRSLM